MLHTATKVYQLRFTYNALVEYEEKFQQSLLMDAKRTNMVVLRRIVWAGLLHEKASYSLQQAGDIIEAAIEYGADLLDVQAEIAAAIDDAVFLQRLVAKSAERQAQKKQREKN